MLGIRLEKFAGGEVADKAAVGGEELVLGKFLKLDPFELVEDFVLEFAFERRHGEELQVNGASVAVVVPDVGNPGPDLCADAQFFLEFASEGLFRAFALLDFAAGKLPLQRHRLVGTALADQDKAVAHQQPRNDESEGGPQGARVGDGLRFVHDSSVNPLQQAPMGCTMCEISSSEMAQGHFVTYTYKCRNSPDRETLFRMRSTFNA